jgi:hypothetical protein
MAATKVQNTPNRTITLQRSSGKKERLRKDKVTLLRRWKVILSLPWKYPHGDGPDPFHGCTPSNLIGKDPWDESKRTNCNAFVVLMFIHLSPSPTTQPGSHRPAITPRRVLLDTGADFNLISSGAHAELNLTKQPYDGLVQSIGGCTMFDGIVFPQWHFRSPAASLGHSLPLHSAPFYVLPAEADVKFDCIIGRQWIEENWTEFIALVEMNRQRMTLAQSMQ